MKKRPFLMALLVIGAIFLFFLFLVVAVARFVKPSTHFPIGEKVGVIEIEGVIASSREINRQLIDFRDNSSIKAIVLRVNSPGGGVGPSQEIYEEVKRTVETKPVVISMGAVAASGGYYVAAPATTIFANPGTITGSIGVIMQFTDFRELLEKIGLKNRVVKSGKFKDLGSPVRPMTEEDRQLLQGLIDDVHEQFLQAVAEGRTLELDRLRPIADGRIFTGRQALEHGLVDELGNLQDAVREAGALAGIEGKPRIVYPPEEKPDLLEYLIQETMTQVRQRIENETATGLYYRWLEN